MENEYIPPETPTTTTPVVTTTPLIPYAEQTRVNVKVKLTSEVFTSDLADPTSDAYKSLKTAVVETVILNVSVCMCVHECMRAYMHASIYMYHNYSSPDYGINHCGYV